MTSRSHGPRSASPDRGCQGQPDAAVLATIPRMVRGVVLVKLHDGYDGDWLADLFRRLRAMGCPGTIAYTIGTDLGLRSGGWTFAIVADFVDAEAYRGYDADELHNELRAELAVHVEEIARVQFEV
jgi:Stress responsive A/B Barrel Domain